MGSCLAIFHSLAGRDFFYWLFRVHWTNGKQITEAQLRFVETKLSNEKLEFTEPASQLLPLLISARNFAFQGGGQ